MMFRSLKYTNLIPLVAHIHVVQKANGVFEILPVSYFSLTDSEEGDRDQPVSAGYNGWRCS